MPRWAIVISVTRAGAQETKTHYPGCGHTKRGAVSEEEFCPGCRQCPKEVCASCSRVTVLSTPHLCEFCHRRESHRKRRSERRVKIGCAVCGKEHISTRLNRICTACWTVQVNGNHACSNCHRLRVIVDKGKQLCGSCARKVLVGKRLHNYVEQTISSFPYNNFLFDLLAGAIEWEVAGRGTEAKLHAFGAFLAMHELTSPLTWEQIEEVLASLEVTKSAALLIRVSLFDVGHLLAAKGELEPYEIYQKRKSMREIVKQAPEQIQPLLQKYTAWLLERGQAFGTVRKHLYTLAAFWWWCEGWGICSPEAIQAIVVNEYLLTQYWKWQCSARTSV